MCSDTCRTQGTADVPSAPGTVAHEKGLSNLNNPQVIEKSQRKLENVYN